MSAGAVSNRCAGPRRLELIPARSLIQNTWYLLMDRSPKWGRDIVCLVSGLARQARAPSTEQRRKSELRAGST